MAMEASFTLTEEELSCPICFEEFSCQDRDKYPKLLLCLHTFCVNCMETLRKYDGSLQCSICRANHTVHHVRDLLDNYVIYEHLRVKQISDDEKLAQRLGGGINQDQSTNQEVEDIESTKDDTLDCFSSEENESRDETDIFQDTPSSPSSTIPPTVFSLSDITFSSSCSDSFEEISRPITTDNNTESLNLSQVSFCTSDSDTYTASSDTEHSSSTNTAPASPSLQQHSTEDDVAPSHLNLLVPPISVPLSSRSSSLSLESTDDSSSSDDEPEEPIRRPETNNGNTSKSDTAGKRHNYERGYVVPDPPEDCNVQ